ncbi:MAG: inner membrane protein YiaA [Comamonas sp.]|uniref:inner membrane protein YiaA n=1 Tax=Comamonas sp. TaxID=34028 RepID=UPI003053D5ED
MNTQQTHSKPSSAFVAASWAALLLGIAAFMAGLWNANMQLNEKGFYFAVLVLGLYSAISLQKSVRDRLEGIPVTGIYFGISWVALIIAVLLLATGLFNATLQLSEKGFYGMAFALGLFGAIAVQKNTRDNLGGEAGEERSEKKRERAAAAAAPDAAKPTEGSGSGSGFTR